MDNREHVQPIYKKLQILNLHNHINLNLGKLMWKLTNKSLPKCILENFSSCFHSTFRTNNLRVPLGRTHFKTRSIFCKGPTLWNSLPQDIKNSASLPLFSKKLKKYLLNLELN